VRLGKLLEKSIEIAEDLDGHSRADAPGIDELAVIGVVAEQQCPKLGPRSFRVGPADDQELLAVKPFCYAPQSTISRRVGRVDRL
jgi:hypothetical protein